MFPVRRMRRLRINESIRDMLRENTINGDRLVMPVFVDENIKSKKELSALPGIYTHSPESYMDYVMDLEKNRVRSILLFGVPETKDSKGTSSYDRNGVVQKAIDYAKSSTRMNIVADLCLCEYTDHGHCGLVEGGYVNNDRTLEIYQKIALSYAEAGVDIIAPSGMMDGQVRAIREALDGEGFENVIIMAYSSKYSSNLYGPFREAAQSTPGFGDRKSYQMDYSNSMEAMREIDLDIKEGADIVMVKPALFYLDIISKAKELYNMPLAAYNVSGEYTMIMSAIKNGYLGKDTINEAVTSIFRAGADIVISYFTEALLREKMS